jgi:hypothetical protein
MIQGIKIIIKKTRSNQSGTENKLQMQTSSDMSEAGMYVKSPHYHI